ncbi:hypothetical protein Fmac_005357 [Flemingia macrophylla]|uniref:Uncharacterized protein n=1 Tax=Flemingia macrophylla TaxID=520843 RepID=A0ABD1N8J6_9FABA
MQSLHLAVGFLNITSVVVAPALVSLNEAEGGGLQNWNEIVEHVELVHYNRDSDARHFLLQNFGNPIMTLRNKAKTLGSCAQNKGGSTLLSVEKVKDVAKVGLSTIAMKTKSFVDHEEREIQTLC